MTYTITPFDPRPGDLSGLEQEMYALGVMKTIYVPCSPDVLAVKHALAQKEAEVLRMYESPHYRCQDPLHHIFFDRYIEWSKAAVNIDSNAFSNRYPASGSSEAIRETIAWHGNCEQKLGRVPRIHIFTGEYEGYRAYAEAHDVTVVEHARDDYEASMIEEVRTGDRFYLSAPSGIDGNIWAGYDAFLRFLENELPDIRLMLDLAYLNTTTTTPVLRTGSPVINGIFVSHSKAFPGTYYDRIGGIFSKDEIPGLYGNMWFKNLRSLLLGVNLMDNFPLGELAKRLQPMQAQVIAQLQEALGADDIVASDVTFIATQPLPESPTEFQSLLTRGDRVRYCLTPGLTKLLN
jgi:hypothetical protein